MTVCRTGNIRFEEIELTKIVFGKEIHFIPLNSLFLLDEHLQLCFFFVFCFFLHNMLEIFRYI